MGEGTRVIVADEESLVRAGLLSVIRNNPAVGSCWETGSIGDVAAVASRHQVDLAIIDKDLALAGSPVVIRELRSSYPDLRIAVVSRTADRETILQVLSAGAHGFIPKSLSPDEMNAAISAIISGLIFVPSVLADLNEAEARPAQGSHYSSCDLTARQLEILRLVETGQSNKQIARVLHIAEGTVKVHLNAAFKALGVHGRVSAIKAVQHLTGKPTSLAPNLFQWADRGR